MNFKKTFFVTMLVLCTSGFIKAPAFALTPAEIGTGLGAAIGGAIGFNHRHNGGETAAGAIIGGLLGNVASRIFTDANNSEYTCVTQGRGCEWSSKDGYYRSKTEILKTATVVDSQEVCKSVRVTARRWVNGPSGAGWVDTIENGCYCYTPQRIVHVRESFEELARQRQFREEAREQRYQRDRDEHNAWLKSLSGKYGNSSVTTSTVAVTTNSRDLTSYGCDKDQSFRHALFAYETPRCRKFISNDYGSYDNNVALKMCCSTVAGNTEQENQCKTLNRNTGMYGYVYSNGITEQLCIAREANY